MAETIFKSLETNSEIEVCSRGLVVLFSEPFNPKVETVLKSHNLDLVDKFSVGLKQTEINERTLILTMNESQKKHIIDNFQCADTIYTLKEYVGELGDVIDPYGKTLVEYEECYVELARLVKKTVYKLNDEGEQT